MRRRMPVVSVAGVAVAALALLPLGYLPVRSSELGWERVFEIAFSDRTRGLLWRTGLLVVTVTASAVDIAAPVAGRTVRIEVDRKRAVLGKRVSHRVLTGGSRTSTKQKTRMFNTRY